MEMDTATLLALGSLGIGIMVLAWFAGIAIYGLYKARRRMGYRW